MGCDLPLMPGCGSPQVDGTVMTVCAVIAPEFSTRAAARCDGDAPGVSAAFAARSLGSRITATLLGGLETPATRKSGDVSIGFEFGWLPHRPPSSSSASTEPTSWT
jgi:hypothetical protein